MKKTALLIAASFVTALGVTGCFRDYTPFCYQQIYDLKGVRTDAFIEYDKGNPVPAEGFRSDLQILFEKYPAAVKDMPAGSYRQGWYFKQYKENWFCGEGIGDLCNHAAWFVLNGALSAADQKAYAEKIAKLLLDFDESGALKLLAELRGKILSGGSILIGETFYDEKNKVWLKSRTEFYSGSLNGKVNTKFGLQRNYYECGMLKSEVYFKGDAPIGYAFTFTEDGKVSGIYRYDGKGGREQVYSLLP